MVGGAYTVHPLRRETRRFHLPQVHAEAAMFAGALQTDPDAIRDTDPLRTVSSTVKTVLQQVAHPCTLSARHSKGPIWYRVRVTIPVRHSGGLLGLTITLTLTHGMADLRNGGPPNMGGLYLGLRLGLTIGGPSMAAPNL